LILKRLVLGPVGRIFVTYSCRALRFVWKFNSIQEGFWVAAWLLGSSLIAVFKKTGQASLSQAVELVTLLLAEDDYFENTADYLILLI
jgi:hypothetical protein